MQSLSPAHPDLPKLESFFSVLCLQDELTIVLRKVTTGLRTLILFEGGRRELNSRSERVKTKLKELTQTRCGRHVEYFKKFGIKLTAL